VIETANRLPEERLTHAGLFYFGPIVGSILSSIFGHWVHDLLGRLYVRIHGGKFASEARLYIIYGASAISGTAIILIGHALQNHWNAAGLSVLLGVQIFGINMMSTAVNAYLLDAYPEGSGMMKQRGNTKLVLTSSGEVDVWIVMGRTMGGMMSTYNQLPWVARDGEDRLQSSP
jgi:MFS family permease